MDAPHVLWIDGVGGFATCDQPTTTIGAPSSSNDVQLRILSDLPSRAAIVHRRGQDHLIEPIHRVAINGRQISNITLLSHSDRIRLGETVELEYSQPTQLSGTARLTLVSRHRWHGAIDGALLLGHSCLIGPSSTAHVRCQNWEKDIVLFRFQDQWMVRRSEYTAEGSSPTVTTEPLTLGKRIQGSGFSMTWL